MATAFSSCDLKSLLGKLHEVVITIDYYRRPLIILVLLKADVLARRVRISRRVNVREKIFPTFSPTTHSDVFDVICPTQYAAPDAKSIERRHQKSVETLIYTHNCRVTRNETGAENCQAHTAARDAQGLLTRFARLRVKKSIYGPFVVTAVTDTYRNVGRYHDCW